ncbi:MAG: THUMP domain-containing protein [Crocinitomicaceae bacterium]|nr:THUMP domain-containing protein [Crocinitomicaceae bacterium]
MNIDNNIKITIKTFYGFENVLVEELKELNYTPTSILNRAVQVKGTWHDIYFLNLHLRCAISVLAELAVFSIKSERDLYLKTKQIKWDQLFSYNKTIAVKGAVFSDTFRNTQYPLLLVKDAVVDLFRDKYGKRPDVSTSKPEILLDLYVRNNLVTLSLNTSGAPLFQRGYRKEMGQAPLNEVVAACLLRMSGWDKKTPFLDPFCGSGTILLEAALLSTGLPSNLERRYYAFQNLLNYNPDLWESIYNKIERRQLKLPVPIIGSDISDSMVIKARRNIRSFSFARNLDIQVKPFDSIKNNDDPFFILTNPPYGERMGEDIDVLYESIGNWLKTNMVGSDFWMISSNMEAYKNIGLKHANKIKVFNGNIECSFRKFEIYKGSLKDK